jgi:dTDP-4-dehydrorhamnose reductase
LNNYDYIINCIGIIKPYCQDNDPEGVVKAIQVNALFPHELSSFCPKINIIQIATDCVFSGKEGKSKENKPHDPLDVYGKTKSLGEVHKNNFLNLRCSIIGPENKHKKSLLEWFLGQKENSVLKGFTHHYWNGITTLQFAKVCEKIISQNIFSEMIKIQHTHHVVINNTVTKYELLNIFKTIFHKKVKIVKVNDIGPKTDRSLSSLYSTINPENTLIPMKKAIGDLSDYIDRYNYYERQ